MKNKNILIVIQDYQDNHEAFYNILVNKVFLGVNIDILLCNDKNISIESKNSVKIQNNKNETPIRIFLKNHKQLFKQADLILFEELYTFHLSTINYIFKYGNKSLQIIHNVNKFLNRKLKFNIKSIIAYLFFYIIKHTVKGVVVISQTLKEYIINNELFKNDNVFYIPFNDTNTEYVSKPLANEQIKFTIPGTVNTERRNYKLFLEVFLKFLQENPSVNLKICLLGKIVKLGKEEQNLISRLREINPLIIDTWDEFIDATTYHEELLTTNFLIGNINIHYEENNVTEIYGESKETGVLFIMLQYKIPTLFPVNYNYSKLYDSYIIPYQNDKESLYTTIKELLNLQNTQKRKTLSDHNHYVTREIIRINNNL